MDVCLFLLGAIIVILLWIALYDTMHFVKTKYIITDPRIQKPCSAVVIADLHDKQYGRENALLLDAIREEKPDFVLIAGDVIQAKPGAENKVALHFIQELAKDYPIYYGVGNHEHRLFLYRSVYEDMGKSYKEALKDCGVKMMGNERKDLEEYGLSIVGSQIHHRYYQRRKLYPMKDSYLKGILGNPEESLYTILLAHNPDYFPKYAGWGADLVLSGHVHGGIVRIPIVNKGVASPAIKLFPKYDGGLFEEGKSRMILSRGLGCHTIPVRLFNPGDLIFLRFENGESGIVKEGRKNRLQKG